MAYRDGLEESRVNTSSREEAKPSWKTKQCSFNWKKKKKITKGCNNNNPDYEKEEVGNVARGPVLWIGMIHKVFSILKKVFQQSRCL